MKPFARIAILGLASLLAPFDTLACSCRIFGDGGPRATFRHARAVFVGEILEVTKPTQEQRDAGAGSAIARIRVERYWKGVKSAEIIVSTEIGVICGPHLDIGKKYLVYAFGKALGTVCTRTRRLENADEDLKVLGPGKEFKSR